MKLHCKFQPLVPFWSEDMCVKIPSKPLKLAEHFCTAVYSKKITIIQTLYFNLKSKVMYIIQYFRAQNALYEDFKKCLLWSTVQVLHSGKPL